MNLRDMQNYLFDLDGTLYRGGVRVESADHLIHTLKEAGKRVWYISNNSNHSCEEIANKLCCMGIQAQENEVITPLRIVGTYLRERYGMCRVYVIGSQELEAAVSQAGHKLTDDVTECDTVLVGRDLNFTFDKLQRAGQLLQGGARFVIMNSDKTHPGPDGYDVPETGAVAAAVQCLAEVEPEYIGKPESCLFDYLVAEEKLDVLQSVMIGDNPDTDIAGGISAGMNTIWLSCGNKLQEGVVPTAIYDHLSALYQAVKQVSVKQLEA